MSALSTRCVLFYLLYLAHYTYYTCYIYYACFTYHPLSTRCGFGNRLNLHQLCGSHRVHVPHRGRPALPPVTADGGGGEDQLVGSGATQKQLTWCMYPAAVVRRCPPTPVGGYGKKQIVGSGAKPLCARPARLHVPICGGPALPTFSPVGGGGEEQLVGRGANPSLEAPLPMAHRSLPGGLARPCALRIGKPAG